MTVAIDSTTWKTSMARISYVDKEQLGTEYQELMIGNYNAFRALAHSPECCRSFREMVYCFKRGNLDPRLRELAMLQVGWLAQCEYEWCHHVAVALENGVSEEEIDRLIAGAEHGDRGTQDTLDLVLLAARQMFAGPCATEEVISSLERALGTERLVELVITIGFYIGAVRVLSSLAIDLEPEYEEYRTRFPMRSGVTT